LVGEVGAAVMSAAALSLIGSVALVAVVGAWVLPEARSATRHPLDLASVVLSTAGILGIVYGITELAHTGLGFWPAYPALVVGAVLSVVFLRRQRRLTTPLLDLQLFSQKGFSAAIVAPVSASISTPVFAWVSARQVIKTSVEPSAAGALFSIVILQSSSGSG
jgi:DHA2 family multidrug resistance protein-like MFS transporter